MKRNNFIANITVLFILFSSAISFLVTLVYFSSFPKGYGGMVLLPLVYLILCVMFFIDLIHGSSNPFVVYGVLIMEWIRFVLMPPFCAMAGETNGVIYINPTIQSLQLSIVFMVIEFFFVGLLCNLFIKKKMDYHSNIGYRISGNVVIYLLFFAFSLGMYFFGGRGKGLIRFLMIKVGSGERVGDVTDTFSLMIRQLVLCSIFLGFVLLVHYFWKKFIKSGRAVFVFCALAVAAINISIIVGERRSAQIYALLCSIYILTRLFPEYQRRIMLSLTFVAGAVLFLMSIYKFFGAFMYDSYSEAISSSSFDVSFISSNLQSYFFGPQNVAIGIDFFNQYTGNIFQMFFDFIRSIFGFSFLFKDFGLVTSVEFNSFIYGSSRETGHILSAISYGYGFLGPIFIPFISLINVSIAILVENSLYKLKSLEVIYVVLYVLTRFVTNLFVNTPQLLSQATLMAFSSFFVIGIATAFNNKQKEILK